MVRNRTLIEVLEENRGRYLHLDGVRGLAPDHPMSIVEVKGDTVYLTATIGSGNEIIKEDRRVRLKDIFRVREAKPDRTILWETDVPNYELKFKLTKVPVAVEFDFQVDTRFLHITGYADEVKFINGVECLHLESYHDGVLLSKMWLELEKIHNLKIGGYKW